MSPNDAEPEQPDLSTSERAELARLRAELDSTKGHPGRAARGWRWTGGVAILVVAGLLFSVSVVAVYLRTQLLNTDRYVETVAPLARDPAIQDAITARVTQEFMTKLDIAGLAKQLADALVARGAPPALDNLVTPITSGVQSFISSQVHNVVTSERFAQVWDSANRVAHDEIDAVLTTGQGKLLTAEGTEVSLNVGSLLTEVKQRLVANGFALAAKVPETTITVPLFHADQLPRIRSAVSLLNTLAWLLPLVALLLLLAGLMVIPNHRRGLLVGAAIFFVWLAILLGALAAVRTYYLNHLPSTIQSPDAARVLYDNQVRFLVAAIETLLVLFGIVVVLCLVFGPNRPAVLLRRGVDAGLDAAGRALGRTGVPLGGVPAFLRHQRRVIVTVAVVLAVAILVLWQTPGIAGVVWLTVGVLVLLGLLEIVARAEGTGPAAGVTPRPHPAG